MKDPLDRHTVDVIDPTTCGCWATHDNNHVITPRMCAPHKAELAQLLGPSAHMAMKVERYFEVEEEANAEASYYRKRWPVEGYSTMLSVIPISRWWLLRGWWSDSCE